MSKYIPPRPYTCAYLPHLLKGMAALVDAEGQTILIAEEATIKFIAHLENKEFKVDKGKASMWPCLTTTANLFRKMRFMPTKKGRTCGV